GHVERCRVLIHLVDGTADDVAAAWHTVRGELSAYSPVLADKPEILVLNKCDALDKTAIAAKRKALAKAAGIAAGKVATVSGVAGTGVRDLLRRAAAAITDARAAGAAARLGRERRRPRPGRGDRGRAGHRPAAPAMREGARRRADPVGGLA